MLVGRLRLRCARSLSQVYCPGTECVAALARVVAGDLSGFYCRLVCSPLPRAGEGRG
ncbi:hypothetical protein CBM2599_B120095 [Cupriavidus taiwanensis]|nr:hypothetical protein CBM2599_B120095 [Cupriavidus taiwanensis]SOY98295.1 hypothetical protein CBM2600_B130096 [Cupriavidus taiwanensis]